MDMSEKIDRYDGVHGGYSFGVRNTEGERILEMGAALDMVVCNTWFRKKDSRIITYSPDDCSTQIDHILVRNKDRKLVKKVKVISSKEVVSQHCKEEKQPFIPKRKVWNLNERDVKEKFANDFRNMTQRVNIEDHVEDLLKILKDILLSATDNSCGWTKRSPRHKEHGGTTVWTKQ